MVEALSVDFSEIKTIRVPVEIVSGGVSFLFVPINSVRAIEMMNPNQSLLQGICEEERVAGVFVFSKETIKSNSTIHTRVFLPHEEAATGFTSAALGYYLITNGVLSSEPPVKIVSEQGYELGRPSTVITEVRMRDNDIVDVRVGGYAIPVAEGKLLID